MNKLFTRTVLFLMISVLPTLADTVNVNFSTLFKASQDSIEFLNFHNHNVVRIINDGLPASLKDAKTLAEGRKSRREEDYSGPSSVYWVNAKGDFGLLISFAQEFGSGIPQIVFPPDQTRHEMAISGRYYVFRSGEMAYGRQAYAFIIQGVQLPQANMASGQANKKINCADVVVNKKSCFFYTLPRAAE